MRSNCIAEAVREARRRSRLPRGEHTGEDVYLWFRWSRVENGIVHGGVGQVEPHSGMLMMESFVPVEPVAVPWWLAWTRLRFQGRWKKGDWPETKPDPE